MEVRKSLKTIKMKFSIAFVVSLTLSFSVIYAQSTRQTCNSSGNTQTVSVGLNAQGNYLGFNPGNCSNSSNLLGSNGDTLIVRASDNVTFNGNNSIGFDWGSNKVLVVFGSITTNQNFLGSGNTIIVHGSMTVTSGNGFTNAGNIIVSPTGTFDARSLNLNNNASFVSTGNLVLTQNSVNQTAINQSGNNSTLSFTSATVSGGISLSGQNATLNGSDLTLTGGINQSNNNNHLILNDATIGGGLTISGSGSSTFTGQTAIADGLNASGSKVISIDGDITFGGNSQLNGSTSLIINESSSISVSGSFTQNNNSSVNVEIDAAINVQNYVMNGSTALQIDGTLSTQTSGNLNITGSSATVNGSGLIDAPIANNGSPINGNPGSTGNSPDPTPLGTTTSTALVWDNNQWSPIIPSVSDEGKSVIIRENFIKGVSPGNLDSRFGRLRVVGDNVVFNTNGSFLNAARLDPDSNGVIQFTPNSRVSRSTATESNSNGFIRFTKPIHQEGWVFFAFPVKVNANVSLDDIVVSGSNPFTYTGAARNIFQWDASQSSWVSVPLNANTSVGGKAFIYYSNSANAQMDLSVRPGAFNNQAQDGLIVYHDPGSSNPGGSSGWVGQSNDGWVMLQNPFQDVIDWNLVVDAMDASNVFDGTAVYRWDPVNETYASWNRGAPSGNRFLEPYEAFYVKANPNATIPTSFSLSGSFRTSGNTAPRNAPPRDPVLIIDVAGDGYFTQTTIIENPEATDGFDHSFDAYYMAPFSEAPMFYSSNIDSLALSINQLPSIEDSIFLGFVYGSNGSEFSISVNADHFRQQYANLFLLDKVTGQITNLLRSSYTFIHDASAPSERFVLFGSSLALSNEDFTGVDNAAAKFDFTAYFNQENSLVIQTSEWIESPTISVTDLSGKLVFSKQYASNENFAAGSQLTNGVYVVRVKDSNGNSSVKKVMKLN
ncbi:MAG: T9SS C-terminal target domain-containing protein [Flavobacteriales bacterium]|nr:MAG: T9SS C-terminal target domain-containing protein [Flavobacteriales bacterium]